MDTRLKEDHFTLFRYVSLAFKNLRRRMVRTALTISGVGLAVAMAVSLGGFVMGYQGAINRSIDMLGFQVMIMAKGCPYEAATLMLKGGTGLMYLPGDTYEKVKNDPDIESITPIFVGIALKEGTAKDSEKTFTIINGIDVPSFLSMKPWLKFQSGSGRWFSPQSRDEVVLGSEVAAFEHRQVGDSFEANITPYGNTEAVYRQFKVVGILAQAGTQDDGTVFMPLDSARSAFNRPRQLTILGLKLKQFNAATMRDFENKWLKLPEVQVVSLQQVKTTLISLVATAQTMIAAVAVIAVIVALIGVINTILMSVYERTGEIGIMKAIGARRGDIFQLIWLETLVICLFGSVIGSIFAWFGSGLVEKAIRSLADFGVSGSIVLITPGVVGYAILGSAVLGFFAGLYPAWRAASMRPVESIREGV
jgi:putative ABC transport system permease protein